MLFTRYYFALEALALPALAIMIALPSGCSGEQSDPVSSHEAAAVRSGLSIATAEQDADDAAPEGRYPPSYDAGVSVDDDAGEVGPLSDASTESRDGAWASAWSRALVPTTVLPYAQPDQFEDQTLRLIVWPTLSGSSVRVKLSNAYATDPRVIGAAHVARHQSDGAVIADTDRVLTFDGMPSVMIAAGAEVWSDPVELEITAHEDLAISVYLPEAFAPAAFHPIGLRTSYVSSSGDYTASLAMPAPAEGAQTTSMIFFVAEVQVLPSSGTPAQVVALGDSITDGNCSDIDANGSWPDRLSKRLTLRRNGTPVGVINAGISSNRWLASDAAGLRGSERLSPLLEVPGVRWVVLFEGINDISYEHIQQPTSSLRTRKRSRRRTQHRSRSSGCPYCRSHTR